MCSNCEDEGVGRRGLLKLGAAGIVALGLGSVSWHARAAEGAATKLSPGEALAALKSGNERMSAIRNSARSTSRSGGTLSPRTRRPGQRSSAVPTAVCRQS